MPRGHVVDRSGVDPADERVDHGVDDALAELAGHERADGSVADRPPDVGPGQHGIAGEAQRAAGTDDAGAGCRPEPRRDPEGVAVRQRAQATTRPHRRTPRRNGHERVGDPHLPAQVDGLAPPAEERVGSQVDHASADVVALQGTAESRRRLQEGDRRRSGRRSRATGQLPCRGQAADAAADDDHAPRRRRHVRAPHRRR